LLSLIDLAVFSRCICSLYLLAVRSLQFSIRSLFKRKEVLDGTYANPRSSRFEQERLAIKLANAELEEVKKVVLGPFNRLTTKIIEMKHINH